MADEKSYPIRRQNCNHTILTMITVHFRIGHPQQMAKEVKKFIEESFHISFIKDMM